jgi:hypothetical protein
MRKITGYIMLLLALGCAMVALGTVINLGFIIMRPDSVSVVNVFIGQFVMIVGALVLAGILYKSAQTRL